MDINDGHDETSYSGVTGTKPPRKWAQERIISAEFEAVLL